MKATAKIPPRHTPIAPDSYALLKTCPDFNAACDLVDSLTDADNTDFLIEETAQGWQVLHRQGEGHCTVSEQTASPVEAFFLSLAKTKATTAIRIYTQFCKGARQ